MRTPSPDSDRKVGYTAMAKVLHWLMATLLFCQFTVAWTMPHIGPRTIPETLINLHFSLGVLLLLVAAVRLAWRWTHPEPSPIDGVPPWQVSSARTVHIILYVLLFIIPILGWIDASWRDFQVTLFGLFSLPPLITAHAAGWGWIGDAHAILSNFGLTGAFGLHVVATLYHEFIRKDRILERMLPARWLAGSR